MTSSSAPFFPTPCCSKIMENPFELALFDSNNTQNTQDTTLQFIPTPSASSTSPDQPTPRCPIQNSESIPSLSIKPKNFDGKSAKINKSDNFELLNMKIKKFCDTVPVSRTPIDDINHLNPFDSALVSHPKRKLLSLNKSKNHFNVYFPGNNTFNSKYQISKMSLEALSEKIKTVISQQGESPKFCFYSPNMRTKRPFPTFSPSDTTYQSKPHHSTLSSSKQQTDSPDDYSHFIRANAKDYGENQILFAKILRTMMLRYSVRNKLVYGFEILVGYSWLEALEFSWMRGIALSSFISCMKLGSNSKLKLYPWTLLAKDFWSVWNMPLLPKNDRIQSYIKYMIPIPLYSSIFDEFLVGTCSEPDFHQKWFTFQKSIIVHSPLLLYICLFYHYFYEESVKDESSVEDDYIDDEQNIKANNQLSEKPVLQWALKNISFLLKKWRYSFKVISQSNSSSNSSLFFWSNTLIFQVLSKWFEPFMVCYPVEFSTHFFGSSAKRTDIQTQSSYLVDTVTRCVVICEKLFLVPNVKIVLRWTPIICSILKILLNLCQKPLYRDQIGHVLFSQSIQTTLPLSFKSSRGDNSIRFVQYLFSLVALGFRRSNYPIFVNLCHFSLALIYNIFLLSPKFPRSFFLKPCLALISTASGQCTWQNIDIITFLIQASFNIVNKIYNNQTPKKTLNSCELSSSDITNLALLTCLISFPCFNSHKILQIVYAKSILKFQSPEGGKNFFKACLYSVEQFCLAKSRIGILVSFEPFHHALLVFVHFYKSIEEKITDLNPLDRHAIDPEI